ncbi:hypothetical protein T07_9138 [Trichinella nelsoni]|uniref:Uncharacterized protein n=1 Tax=Trichinella nelsoni TaxID=6336 RepID=A0A0V0RW97_9BILA|nr:hypothetical protein T07_9138 [Trichinella nelsoni]
MDNSLLDPASKPFDIAQILLTPNNKNEIIMMPITRFLLAKCKIGNVDELCLRKLKNSETLMKVVSVDVDGVNHFYDFAYEGVIEILPSCHWFLFQWLTFFLDAVLCMQCYQEQRKNRHFWTNVECRTALYTLHGSICEKPLRSINSVASHYPHSMEASGRSERPSGSSESSTAWYTVGEHLKLMNLGSASGPDGVKVSRLREICPHCFSKVFKTFLLERNISQILKDCRTTLIPKLDKPRPDAEGFRSMTVGSCVYIPAVQQDCNGWLSEVTPPQPPSKCLPFDGVTSGCPGEVSKNIIRKECGSSLSRATRVGVETIGFGGLLSECKTFGTHFENDREQGKDLRTCLEECLTSSNIEMEEQTLSQMDNSLLDPASKPFDIAQILLTPNNKNES